MFPSSFWQQWGCVCGTERPPTIFSFEDTDGPPTLDCQLGPRALSAKGGPPTLGCDSPIDFEGHQRLPAVPERRVDPSVEQEEPRRPPPPSARLELLPAVPEPGTVNMGPWEPMTSLIEEFKYNEKLHEKIYGLRDQGYIGWRRVRGDGNCFYRSVGYGFLELLVAATPERRKRWLGTFLEGCRCLHFHQEADVAVHARLLNHLELLGASGGWQAPSCQDAETTAMGLLYRSLRDKQGELDLAFIRAMRHLCAKYLVERAHTDCLSEGISVEALCTAQGFRSTEAYCEEVILPMGRDAEGYSLTVLPRVLGVNLRIAYLDRVFSDKPSFVDYCTDGKEHPSLLDGDEEEPLIHVQLRPGHYDMVYHRTWFRGMPEPQVLRQPTFSDADGAEYYLEEDPEPVATTPKKKVQRRRPKWCA